jgi:predicted DNA-binding transcriptional regulator
VSRDQALGAAIFVLCVAVAVGYTLTVAVPQFVKDIMPWLPWTASEMQFGATAIAVLAAFLAIMFMGAWIGWTMATTQPSKPTEERETDEPEDSENKKQ